MTRTQSKITKQDIKYPFGKFSESCKPTQKKKAIRNEEIIDDKHVIYEDVNDMLSNYHV